MIGRSIGLSGPPVHALRVCRADGKVRPAIDSSYPLEDVVGALRKVNDGRARGKVLVTVAAE